MILLIGGAQAGKSALAVKMAEKWTGPVVFIATAEPRDDEMAERISRHKTRRPKHWETIEEPLELDGAFSKAPDDAFVIADCLTLWVSNLMEQGRSDSEIQTSGAEAARIAASRSAPTVVVTNEVGFGIVPANELARRYRDVLGSVNTIWAGAAETTLLVIAGRAIRLGEETLG